MTIPRTLPRPSEIPWSQVLATGLFALTLAVLVVDVVLWGGQRFRAPPVTFVRGQGILIMEMFMAVSYGAMGWLLAHRISRNPLGWLFLVIGVVTAMQMTATFLVQEDHQAFRQVDYGDLWAAWLSSSVYLPLLVGLFVVVFLRFPDGRPLSRRWGYASWLAAIGTVLVIATTGLSPEGLLWYPSLPNPIALSVDARPALAVAAVIGLVLLVSGTLIAAASMAVRYSRAGDIQRAQLRWIAVAVLLLAGGGVPFLVIRYALRLDYAAGEVMLIVAVGAACFLPIAAAVAVLRHRLYDIDVIIGRALVYIPLTGILGGLYTAGVAGAQRVFVTLTGDRSDAAIVITTLVLASMFTPIKNWLQAIVDRRFKPGAGHGHAAAPHVTLETLSARVAALEQAATGIPTAASSASVGASANPEAVSEPASPVVVATAVGSTVHPEPAASVVTPPAETPAPSNPATGAVGSRGSVAAATPTSGAPGHV